MCDLHCLVKIKKYIVNIKIIEIILFTQITKKVPILCMNKFCASSTDHKGKKMQILFSPKGLGAFPNVFSVCSEYFLGRMVRNLNHELFAGPQNSAEYKQLLNRNLHQLPISESSVYHV